MRNKIIAYSLGITCHLCFVVAISIMAYMLFEGLTESMFSYWHPGRIFNVVLLLQFPVFHSFFLSRTGRRFMELPFPKEIAKDLWSTTFSLFSSLQLLSVFLLWTPDHEIWFAPTGQLLYLWTFTYILTWVFLGIALFEAGMGMHTGFLGWYAVARGTKPQYPPLSQRGLHNQCRHPIYLTFAAIILTAPVWSFDHFVLSIIWVGYCLIGPLFKERRLSKLFQQEYQRYQEFTPYIVPKILHFGSWQIGNRRE